MPSLEDLISARVSILSSFENLVKAAMYTVSS